MNELIYVSLFVLSGTLFAIWHERKEWNKGICKKSGKPWIYFDSCFCGDQGYHDGEGNVLWISYKSAYK